MVGACVLDQSSEMIHVDFALSLAVQLPEVRLLRWYEHVFVSMRHERTAADLVIPVLR